MALAPSYDGLVETVVEALRPLVHTDPLDFERAAVQHVIPEALAGGDPASVLAWAREHRLWSFIVADVEGTICGKPREAVVMVLLGIAQERLGR